MNKSQLLHLLCDGAFHSGQELADQLGVSRTAVWKQIQKLQEMGLQPESVKGRGYRLPGGLDMISNAGVVAQLKPEALSLLGDLLIHDCVDSTNAELMRRVDEGAAKGLVCSAEQQLAGRGRRGRSWVSPFGQNIYLSVAWEYAQGVAVLEGLSLAVGVALINALESLGVVGLKLKWPNDVLAAVGDGGEFAKLGGILIEIVGDSAGTCHAVVGVGLNVAMADVVGLGIDQAWTDIAHLNIDPQPDRSSILAEAINHLLPMLAQYAETGFGAWHAPWLALDAYADRPVSVLAGSKAVTGIARGVNERGALLLETSVGIQPFYGGEISLRGRN